MSLTSYRAPVTWSSEGHKGEAEDQDAVPSRLSHRLKAFGQRNSENCSLVGPLVVHWSGVLRAASPEGSFRLHQVSTGTVDYEPANSAVRFALYSAQELAAASESLLVARWAM
jgi:hypothetical protein